MRKCAVAAMVLALMGLSPSTSQAEPAYWSGMGTTSHEEAVAACEEEDNLAEYGEGDFDQCVDEYQADLEMIERPLPKLEPTLPSPDYTIVHEDEPGWDCHTMGNKICGELPRTN